MGLPALGTTQRKIRLDQRKRRFSHLLHHWSTLNLKVRTAEVAAKQGLKWCKPTVCEERQKGRVLVHFHLRARNKNDHQNMHQATPLMCCTVLLILISHQV